MRKVFPDSVISIVKSKPYLVDLYAKQVADFIAIVRKVETPHHEKLRACHRMRGGALALAGDDVAEVLLRIEALLGSSEFAEKELEAFEGLALKHIEALKAVEH